MCWYCQLIFGCGYVSSTIEAFQKKAGSATVLVKAFVSVGAALLPFFMAFFIARDMFYGYTFFLMAAVYLVNGFSCLRFHSRIIKPKARLKNDEQTVPVQHQFLSKPKFAQEGLAVILIRLHINCFIHVGSSLAPELRTRCIGANPS